MRQLELGVHQHYAVQRQHNKYWGDGGAVCAALFVLLFTLERAMESTSSKKHKFFTGVGIALLYGVIRMSYEVRALSPEQLGILASVSRRLRFHHHAIFCGETGLGLIQKSWRDLMLNPMQGYTFTSQMLIIAGLVRDYDAIHSAYLPDSKAHHYWAQLRQWWDTKDYTPPETQIDILCTLAWISNKYPTLKHSDARWYAQKAFHLAQHLGAYDQVARITREFWDLLHSDDD